MSSNLQVRIHLCIMCYINIFFSSDPHTVHGHSHGTLVGKHKEPSHGVTGSHGRSSPDVLLSLPRWQIIVMMIPHMWFRTLDFLTCCFHYHFHHFFIGFLAPKTPKWLEGGRWVMCMHTDWVRRMYCSHSSKISISSCLHM